MPREPHCVDWTWIWSTKLIATATSFEGSKTNFRSFINRHSSTNPANLVKIGHVDVGIIGLTEIVKKIKKETTAKHKSTFSCAPSPGGLENYERRLKKICEYV